MLQHVHKTFLDISSAESAELNSAISLVGPFELKPKQDMPLAVHLCRSVVGQQLSTKAADSIWKRLLALSEKNNLLDFIHVSSIQDLRNCGLSAAKSRTLNEISKKFISGEIDQAQFHQLDCKDRSKRITQIWGIGEWTADMLNIFYFGEPDIWPRGDLAAVSTFEKLTGNVEISEKFKPFRSYLALYMWKYRDNEWATNKDKSNE